MVPVAVVILPGTTLSLSNERMVKVRLNVSEVSVTLSMFTVILISMIVDPAVKVTLIGVES